MARTRVPSVCAPTPATRQKPPMPELAQCSHGAEASTPGGNDASCQSGRVEVSKWRPDWIWSLLVVSVIQGFPTNPTTQSGKPCSLNPTCTLRRETRSINEFHIPNPSSLYSSIIHFQCHQKYDCVDVRTFYQRRSAGMRGCGDADLRDKSTLDADRKGRRSVKCPAQEKSKQ